MRSCFFSNLSETSSVHELEVAGGQIDGGLLSTLVGNVNHIDAGHFLKAQQAEVVVAADAGAAKAHFAAHELK